MGTGRRYDVMHAPVGTSSMTQAVSDGMLQGWFSRRAIPSRRIGIDTVRAAVRGVSETSVMEASLALGLSDAYWLKPVGSSLAWDDVNMFSNRFDTWFGDVTVGESDGTAVWRDIAMSPEASTGGNLPKRWMVAADGARMLVKGGSGHMRQEPFNEVAASRICDALGIGHVPYTLVETGIGVCSACPCAVGPSEDFVTAYDVCIDGGRYTRGPVDDIRHFMEFGGSHGIDMSSEVGKMTLVDYVIRNMDRHWTNFGFIRDADTLEYKRAFPLYDFGNSLWHDGSEVKSFPEGMSKFSHMSLQKDLRYVASDLDVDARALADVGDIVVDALAGSGMGQMRVDAVAEAAAMRAADAARWQFGLEFGVGGKGIGYGM